MGDDWRREGVGIVDEWAAWRREEADLFMIDARRAHLVPTLRIVSGSFPGVSRADIMNVMVTGEWVMRDGGF